MKNIIKLEMLPATNLQLVRNNYNNKTKNQKKKKPILKTENITIKADLKY